MTGEPIRHVANAGAGDSIEEKGLVYTKHKDTKWEKFRNNFPKSSDQEYKRFNPYDIMMDALDKAANSKGGLDDMFFDLMLAVMCMPFDQIKAVCDFKRRKRQEEENGTKAKKDLEKLTTLLNAGVGVYDDDFTVKKLDAAAKAMGFDRMETPNGGNSNNAGEKISPQQTAAMAEQYFNDPNSLTEEQRKVLQDAVSKLDIKPEDMRDLKMEALEKGINEDGCKKLGEMFGVKYEGDVDKLAKDIGKALSEDPKLLDKVKNEMKEGVDTLVDAATSERHDYLRKEITDMERAQRTGKTAEYTEDRLTKMLDSIGYDKEEIKDIKDSGQLTIGTVKTCFRHEEKRMNADLAQQAAKEASKMKTEPQKTTVQNKAKAKTQSNTAAKPKQASGNAMATAYKRNNRDTH